MNKKYIIIVFIALFLVFDVIAQGTTWKRRIPQSEVKLQLFHSTHAINLPTSETLQKGDFHFDISHRFIPTIKSGSKEFWGFDGPANIRLALGYAITNNILLTLGRSNQNNNVDLAAKLWLFQVESESFPITSSIIVGSAWNSDAPSSNNIEYKTFQFFGQLIINTMWQKKLGIGIVPSYLYNSHIQCEDTQYSITMGTYLQFYFSTMYSLILEWNPTMIGWRQDYNPVSLGFEIETGGHFFKIVLTNSADLNMSQFLAGADNQFSSGEWRFGFNITRVL